MAEQGINPKERFSGGNGENVFNSLLIQEYGKSIAQSGGIGLADNIERQLISLQEGK